MSNYNQIGTLFDRVEKLIGVRYSLFDAGSGGRDFLVAVELQFENTVATIYVEAEFDTLRIELDAMKSDEDCFTKEVSLLKPWIDALDRPLSWIWVLKNQQGYEDGLRFEFSSKENGPPTIVTLIGMASSIEVYTSEKVGIFFATDPKDSLGCLVKE